MLRGKRRWEALLQARGYKGLFHGHQGRKASCHRNHDAARGGICPQRRLPRRPETADYYPDRSEHGRKIRPAEADRPYRDNGPDGLLCSGRKGNSRHPRQGFHPRRRLRQHLPRGIHLHGGNDGNGHDPPQPVPTLPGADGRDRPRHLHLRRNVHRPRYRGIYP